MKITCEWFHNKFDPSCKNCRQIFCKDCKDFMVSFEMFLKNTDEIDNQYLKYFVSDFLNISNQTLENYFPEAVKKTIPIEKKLVIKSYKKIEKNRDQVVN